MPPPEPRLTEIKPDYLMSSAAVCKLFGVSAVTLWSWRRRHDFPTISIPSRFSSIHVFSARAVRAWGEQKGFTYLVASLPKPFSRPLSPASTRRRAAGAKRG